MQDWQSIISVLLSRTEWNHRTWMVIDGEDEVELILDEVTWDEAGHAWASLDVHPKFSILTVLHGMALPIEVLFDYGHLTIGWRLEACAYSENPQQGEMGFWPVLHMPRSAH